MVMPFHKIKFEFSFNLKIIVCFKVMYIQAYSLLFPLPPSPYMYQIGVNNGVNMNYMECYENIRHILT